MTLYPPHEDDSVDHSIGDAHSSALSLKVDDAAEGAGVVGEREEHEVEAERLYL